METLLNLTFAQAFGGIAGIAVLLSIFIEITPIKINPVSAFLSWIGKKANKEISEKFDKLDKKVNTLEMQLGSLRSQKNERDAINCRIRILQFGDEIRRGMKHSEENFNQILSDIDEYERYCEEHKDFKNNKTVQTKKRILDVYSRCVDENDFL